jgi:PAS domain S-box-containing protein
MPDHALPDHASADELRRSAELYRSIVHQLPALSYLCDADGTTTYVHERQLDRLLGEGDNDHGLSIDQAWEQRVHPDDRERVVRQWHEAVALGRSHEDEYRMLRRDGGTIWVRDVESIVRDDDGAFLHRQGLMFDITDLVEARQHAADAEERFRSLTEQMPAVMYRDTADAGAAIYVSPAVEQLLGFTPEEWLTGSLDWYWGRVHPDDRDRVIAGVRHSVATATAHTLTYRIRHRQGHYLHVRDSVVFVSDEHGAPRWRQGMLTDVSDEVDRAQRLDQADQRFRTLVDQMPAVIYLDDMDMKPMYVSPRVEEVFGCSVDAWLSSADSVPKSIGDAVYPQVLDAYRALRDNGDAYLTEYSVTRPDGTKAWVRDQAQRVHDSEGVPFALQGVIVDITDRKLAEQRALRYVEQQRIVADLGMRALAGDGLLELADEAVRSVARGLGESHVWMLEVDQNDDTVRVRAAFGWPEDTVGLCASRAELPALAHEVLSVDTLVNVTDLAGQATLWPELIASQELRSAAGVRIGSTPAYGILGVHSRDTIAVDDDDVSFLHGVANVLAAAIGRDRSRRELEQSEARRREALSALVRSGEEQRQRIATELHDDTIQIMTAALIALDREAGAIAGGDQVRAFAANRELRETLYSAVERTRRLTFELRPPVLEARGLAAALHDLLAEMGRAAGCQVELETATGRLAEEVESLAYRTVQELVTNARKHARATKLSVRLHGRSEALHVVVSDDGVGFDRERAAAGGAMRLHFGLESSAERITLAGGEFKVDSAPGAGTTVRFSIPLVAA